MACALKLPRFVSLAVALALLSGLFHTASAMADPVKLMILGTTLAADEGLPYADSYPAQLEKALQAAGHDVTIIDNGVSGETTAKARARLDWILAEPVDGVILELGSADGAKGVAPDEVSYNLDAILRALRTRKLPMLLAGAKAPASAKPDYAEPFEANFAQLAVQYDAIFYPDALDGVAGHAQLVQADGVTPNRDGVARIVAAMLPAIEQLVTAIETAKGH